MAHFLARAPVKQRQEKEQQIEKSQQDQSLSQMNSDIQTRLTESR